jgi:hypothetical protein
VLSRIALSQARNLVVNRSKRATGSQAGTARQIIYLTYAYNLGKHPAERASAFLDRIATSVDSSAAQR